MIQLLPYQQKWVDDKSPFKICLHRRRVGMSFAEAHGVVNAVQSGTNCIVVTPDYYVNWLSSIEDIVKNRSLGFNKTHEKGCVNLTFNNSNFVKLISENSVDEVVRGFAGKIVIDNAMWMELDKIFHFIAPVLFFGYSTISVISQSVASSDDSLPLGFNAFVSKAKSEWFKRLGSLHIVSFEQAIADGLYEKIREIKGGGDYPDWNVYSSNQRFKQNMVKIRGDMTDLPKENFIKAHNDECGLDVDAFRQFYKAMEE